MNQQAEVVSPLQFALGPERDLVMALAGERNPDVRVSDVTAATGARERLMQIVGAAVAFRPAAAAPIRIANTVTIPPAAAAHNPQEVREEAKSSPLELPAVAAAIMVVSGRRKLTHFRPGSVS